MIRDSFMHSKIKKKISILVIMYISTYNSRFLQFFSKYFFFFPLHNIYRFFFNDCYEIRVEIYASVNN